MLTSDNAGYLAQARATALRRRRRAPTGSTTVVDASGRAAVGGGLRRRLRLLGAGHGQADAADQDAADQLLAAAGEVNPLTGFAMSAQPDRHVRVVWPSRPTTRRRPTPTPAPRWPAGPAPGQGGDFADRFSVESVTADGRVVTMDLVPREGAYVLSDLSSGPVLFATC